MWRLILSYFRRHYLFCVGLIIVLFGGFLILSPSGQFPRYQILTIAEGQTVAGAAGVLQEAKVIRSRFIFQIALRLVSPRGIIRAGDYYFSESEWLPTVVWRLAFGRYGVPLEKITFPEGLTAREMGAVLARALPNFSENDFIVEAAAFEGRLFPDTYFFPVTVKPRQIVTTMVANFEKKWRALASRAADNGRSFNEIITMASLLEEEAKTLETRKMISGILWKRFDRGMPLQVDAVFPYIIGKNSFDLSLADLKYDSPYNTYLYKGLPPGPISNPGLEAIEAALEPTTSDYWYYLSDRRGVMHYAVDFDEHRVNKFRYLN